MNILSVIDRKSPLFEKDLALLSDEIKEKISTGRFLVIGGAGSIGKVARELFKRNQDCSMLSIFRKTIL